VEGEVGAAGSEQGFTAIIIYWEAFTPPIYFVLVV